MRLRPKVSKLFEYIKSRTRVCGITGSASARRWGGYTQYSAELGLPDKSRAIKGLVVCNSWDLEPWDLLNGLALGCYQPPT